jgi:hypothetical protein
MAGLVGLGWAILLGSVGLCRAWFGYPVRLWPAMLGSVGLPGRGAVPPGGSRDAHFERTLTESEMCKVEVKVGA